MSRRVENGGSHDGPTDAASRYAYATHEVEERKRSGLDALARRRARRRGRIDERAVRGEARAAVLGRIEYLEYQRLVAPHQRKIEPAVIRVVPDAVGLAHAVRIAALGADQVPGGEAARVGDRERVGLDRLVDRAPHLNDGEAAA